MAVTIDLHLHTTASDGRCTPSELVERACARGIQVMSVTDHDTTAGLEAARATAQKLGITFISGIEITSVHNGRDVHVLAYGLPANVPAVDALLSSHRQTRVARAREIAARLRRMGAAIDFDALVALASTGTGKALARPQLAQCLVAAGHASSVADAFDRFLGEGSPAYVPHRGASPVEVVDLVARNGGLASLAHPGTLQRDEIIPELKEAGLLAIEAFHSAHDEPTQARYALLAQRCGLAVTGGSDYHGEGTRRCEFFGRVGMPAAEYPRFRRLLDASSRFAPAVSPQARPHDVDGNGPIIQAVRKEPVL